MNKSNNVTKKFVFAAGALLGASLLTGHRVQASTYTVKTGDTVSKIAKEKYHSSSLSAIETIVQANNLSNRDLIFVGEKLNLPKKIKKFKASSQAPVQVDNSKSYTQASAQSTQPAQSVEQQQPQQPQQPQPQQQKQNVVSQQSSNMTSTTTNSRSVSGGNLQSYVTSRMEAETGVSASVWSKIIQRESNWDANVTNSSGHYGLFQLDGSYNKHGRSIEGQIQDAADLYRKQGLNAWSETAY